MSDGGFGDRRLRAAEDAAVEKDVDIDRVCLFGTN